MHMQEITQDNHLHSGTNWFPCPLYEIAERALPCPCPERWLIRERAPLGQVYVLRIELPRADFLKSLGLSLFACKRGYLTPFSEVDVRLN